MRVHLSLGSNVGDRAANLRAALRALQATEGVTLPRVSQCYETEPVDVTDQTAFVNLAAEIETVLGPLELLNVPKDIERRLGRKPSERWGPRTIDIDIILWESRVLETGGLTLPHKEFRYKAFVLAPLAELVPCLTRFAVQRSPFGVHASRSGFLNSCLVRALSRSVRNSPFTVRRPRFTVRPVHFLIFVPICPPRRSSILPESPNGLPIPLAPPLSTIFMPFRRPIIYGLFRSPVCQQFLFHHSANYEQENT